MSNLSDFNPLEYFSHAPHIIEFIFQHFTCDELIRTATVSTSYQDFIFNSASCMKRVKLIVRDDDRRVQEIVKSDKTHRNVKIQMDKFLSLDQVHSIISKHKKWRSIEINFANDITSLLQSISSYCQNLQELKLFNIKVDVVQDITGSNFNKVKSLLINCCNADLAFSIIASCPNLKKLYLTQIKNLDELITMLAQLRTFQLEDLNVGEYCNYNYERVMTELLNFLKRHFASLKVLQLHLWAGLPVLKLVFCMPYLHRLELFGIHMSHRVLDWSEIELPTSRSITHLRHEDIEDYHDSIECILKSCPNITHIKIHGLDRDLLKSITKLAPKLVELEKDWVTESLKNWSPQNSSLKRKLQ